MDSKASHVLILATILLFQAGRAQGEHTYPRVGNYFPGHVEMEHCEELSKWDVVVLNRCVRDRAPEILTTLRTLNPEIKILTYFPVAAVWAGYDTMDTYARLYGEKVEASDWWLYDTKGNRVGDPEGNWFINFSTECPEDGQGVTVDGYLADHVADRLLIGSPWDGILLDIMFDDPWFLNNSDWFEDPPAMLDLDRDGVADDYDSVYVAWRTSILTFLDNLRQRVGSSYILVGNGKHCISDYLNGGIRENFPFMHGGWEENMFASYGYLSLCSELLDNPMRCVLMICLWERDDNTLYGPRRTASYERFLRYTLCSALLGDGYYFLLSGHRSLWWEDYYDLDLGAPTSEIYCDSLWNRMYNRYSPVWRRDFENAAVYCNPYDEHISFEGGWLSPQDGLIKTYLPPSSAEIEIISRDREARLFDQGDPYLTYKVTIDNHGESAVFASVWATLSREGTTVASSGPVEYLVGARDTTVKNRLMRIPTTLEMGTYCLEVMVGGGDLVEVDRDTMMLTRIIDFEKEQIKSSGEAGEIGVDVYPQPAILGGGNLKVAIRPGGLTGAFCSVRIYDVGGRLVCIPFEDRIDRDMNLDVLVSGRDKRLLGPGVYFLTVDVEDRVLTKKVVLLRRP